MKKPPLIIWMLILFLGFATAQDEEGEAEKPRGERPEGEEGEKPKPPKPGIDREVAKEFKELDRDNDGSIGRREFAASEIAQRLREADKQDLIDAVFDKIDRSGDDAIGLFEYAASVEHRKAKMMNRQTQARFDELDRNDDGVIGRREFSESKVAEKARENGGAEKVSELFAKLDLNGTDSISIFEFAWAHKDPKDRKLNHADAVKFAKLDANDDSAVSRKEFGAGEFAQQARANDNQDAVGEAFDKIDDDGDGEISPREYAAALQRRRMAEADKGKDKPKKDEDGIDPRIVESFRELDRDDDRAVSLREFSRGELADRVDDRDVVEEIFERADANDDDELSLKEYAEFRKHFRGPPPGKKGKGKGKGKGGKR